jgi:hypothetical protein
MTNLLPTAVLYIVEQRQRELEAEARIERALKEARAAARQKASPRTPGQDKMARGKRVAAAPRRIGA